MPNAPKIENCDRLLLVEGYSDLLFYAELLKALGRHEGVFIKPVTGRSNLTVNLDTFLTPQLLAEKTAIGLIVDADTNAQGISDSLSGVLSKVTGQVVSAGNWTNGKPRIGFFVVPDGSSSGEIESLVWQAWAGDPANSRSRQCVESYVGCMNEAGFQPHSPHKGLISSLLAIRYDEDPRLGPGARGAREGIFDFTRPEYNPLKTFLSKL